MILSAIVAIGKNREIGLDNKMLWHIREDFQNYKKITMGHHLIMGRKTFDSIGRPLPGRTSVILSRDKALTREGAIVLNDPKEALEFAKKAGDSEVFINGGAEIYNMFLPEISRLYLSKVDFEGEADTYFPEYEAYDWKIIEETSFAATEKSPAWKFQILEK